MPNANNNNNTKQKEDFRFLNFADRNALTLRLDKIRPTALQFHILQAWLGALTVVCDDPKVWAVLEEKIKERETRQPLLPLSLTESLIETVHKCTTNPLDKS